MGRQGRHGGAVVTVNGEEVVLFCMERRHIDDLRAVSDQLASGVFMDEITRKEAALIIMSAVRFAEVLEAFRRPGGEPKVVCALPRGR